MNIRGRVILIAWTLCVMTVAGQALLLAADPPRGEASRCGSDCACQDPGHGDPNSQHWFCHNPRTFKKLHPGQEYRLSETRPASRAAKPARPSLVAVTEKTITPLNSLHHNQPRAKCLKCHPQGKDVEPVVVDQTAFDNLGNAGGQ